MAVMSGPEYEAIMASLTKEYLEEAGIPSQHWRSYLELNPQSTFTLPLLLFNAKGADDGAVARERKKLKATDEYKKSSYAHRKRLDAKMKDEVIGNRITQGKEWRLLGLTLGHKEENGKFAFEGKGIKSVECFICGHITHDSFTCPEYTAQKERFLTDPQGKYETGLTRARQSREPKVRSTSTFQNMLRGPFRGRTRKAVARRAKYALAPLSRRSATSGMQTTLASPHRARSASPHGSLFGSDTKTDLTNPEVASVVRQSAPFENWVNTALAYGAPQTLQHQSTVGNVEGLSNNLAAGRELREGFGVESGIWGVNYGAEGQDGCRQGGSYDRSHNLDGVSDWDESEPDGGCAGEYEGEENMFLSP